MGGIMKGGHGHMNIAAAYSNGSRRWNVCILTAVIVTLVFGCGILGIHRIRDRRNILNLLIKEKDDQIQSLHLLLQKEREQIQEVIKEREEMKMKAYNLGGQKLELKSKISDMQSTISSLKDELTTIETAFQEKQNETNDQNHRVESLAETLRLKDNEIEDLKHRLQLINASNHSDHEQAENGRSAINGKSENSEETSGENGRSNVERDEDAVTLQAQENSHGENLRIRGKRRSFVRRSNGKRLRVIAKQIQRKSNNKLEEGKPIMIQTNESVVKDQRFTIDDSEQGKTKVQLTDFIEENNGENSTKSVAATNSSIRLDEEPKYSANESDVSESPDKGEDIVITENAEKESYGKHNSSEGEKEAAEKNGDIQSENLEGSDEDKDEPDPDQF